MICGYVDCQRYNSDICKDCYRNLEKRYDYYLPKVKNRSAAT